MPFPRLSPSADRLPALVPAPDQLEQGTSLGRDAWIRLRKNRLAFISLWILVAIAAFCYLGPVLLGGDYAAQDLERTLITPQPGAWFGTDDLGRDQLVRTMIGGRVSLGVGLVATGVSLLIGVLYGAIAGYVGGKLDALMMRFVDVLYALPFTIFVVLLMTVLPRSIYLLFLVIGAVEWLTMARIVRSQVLALRRQDFVEAAISLGLAKRRIILRHIIPNVLGVVVVYATLTVPSVILLESFLSFLGLGVQPPMPSWGSLIKLGADNIQLFPHLLLIPAAFFSITLFALNFLGDGLRDALDPKASKD